MGDSSSLEMDLQSVPSSSTDSQIFYLSERSPLNSVYTTKTGQVIYKVTSPFSLKGKSATIHRVIPNQDTADMQDRFALLAQVDWPLVAPSKIRFAGQNEVEVRDFFRKEGWSWYGRDRIFTAPDGREYKWLMGMRVSKLILNDGSKRPVAVFHRSRVGFMTKARPASFEIYPGPWKNITDVIFVTFIYVEKVRKDRERASESQGG